MAQPRIQDVSLGQSLYGATPASPPGSRRSFAGTLGGPTPMYTPERGKPAEPDRTGDIYQDNDNNQFYYLQKGSFGQRDILIPCQFHPRGNIIKNAAHPGGGVADSLSLQGDVWHRFQISTQSVDGEDAVPDFKWIPIETPNIAKILSPVLHQGDRPADMDERASASVLSVPHGYTEIPNSSSRPWRSYRELDKRIQADVDGGSSAHDVHRVELLNAAGTESKTLSFHSPTIFAKFKETFLQGGRTTYFASVLSDMESSTDRIDQFMMQNYHTVKKSGVPNTSEEDLNGATLHAMDKLLAGPQTADERDAADAAVEGHFRLCSPTAESANYGQVVLRALAYFTCTPSCDGEISWCQMPRDGFRQYRDPNTTHLEKGVVCCFTGVVVTSIGCAIGHAFSAGGLFATTNAVMQPGRVLGWAVICGGVCTMFGGANQLKQEFWPNGVCANNRVGNAPITEQPAATVLAPASRGPNLQSEFG